jgi:hypothetical protein
MAVVRKEVVWYSAGVGRRWDHKLEGIAGAHERAARRERRVA